MNAQLKPIKDRRNRPEELIISFLIDGITPLMTDNPITMLKNVGKKTKKKGDTEEQLSPETEARTALYHFDNSFAIPGLAFRSSILIASKMWKQKNKSIQPLVTHIKPVDELVKILDNKGDPITSYDIDTRRVVNRTTKGAILKSRPKFYDWTANVKLYYEPNIIKEDLLSEIFSDAGNRIGVGSYRPEKNGWFGRFEVVEVNGQNYY